MGKQFKFITIVKDNKMTEFMQACDVFDRGKIVAKVNKITITFTDDTIVNKEKIAATMESLIDAYNEQKEYSIVFIDLSTENIESTPIFDNNVRQISDGEKSFMFHDWLKFFRYTVTTTQDMYIKSVN